MEHQLHPNHDHAHGADCGHVAVRHDDHIDYLHDGHMHRAHAEHFDEHALAISSELPAACAPHACSEHASGHRHGAGCGHEAVPHGDHADYLVSSHLHHPHGEHCDDHGTLVLA